MKYKVISFLTLLLIFLTDCTSNTLTITDKSLNNIYNVKPGTNIEIYLESNPTTGYDWEIIQFDSTIFSFNSELYIANSVTEKKIGSGGNKKYTFKAVKSGSAQLLFQYKRPFEIESASSKTFSVEIVVR